MRGSPVFFHNNNGCVNTETESVLLFILYTEISLSNVPEKLIYFKTKIKLQPLSQVK